MADIWTTAQQGPDADKQGFSPHTESIGAERCPWYNQFEGEALPGVTLNRHLADLDGREYLAHITDSCSKASLQTLSKEDNWHSKEPYLYSDYTTHSLPNHDPWPTIWLPNSAPDLDVMQTDLVGGEASPLLTLPLELRELVYGHYFNTVYALEEPDYGAEASLDPLRGPRPGIYDDPMDDMDPDPTLESTTIDFGGEDITGLKLLVGKPLLRVNRQIRREALVIAIQGKCWFTENVRAFPRLFQCLGQDLLAHVMEIRIEDPFFPCTYENPDSRYPNVDEASAEDGPLAKGGPRVHQDFARWASSMEEYKDFDLPDHIHPSPTTITSSSPLWTGTSYSAYLLRTIALLPRLRRLFMILDIGVCAYNSPNPSSRWPAAGDQTHHAARADNVSAGIKCPTFLALANLQDTGLKRLDLLVEPIHYDGGFHSVVKRQEIADMLTEILGAGDRDDVEWDLNGNRLHFSIG